MLSCFIPNPPLSRGNAHGPGCRKECSCPGSRPLPPGKEAVAQLTQANFRKAPTSHPADSGLFGYLYGRTRGCGSRHAPFGWGWLWTGAKSLANSPCQDRCTPIAVGSAMWVCLFLRNPPPKKWWLSVCCPFTPTKQGHPQQEGTCGFASN